MNNDQTQLELDYHRVEKAINFLRDHHTDQPSLNEIASFVGVSAYHFQRMFTRWAGISPKRFVQYLTLNHAKYLLDGCAARVLDTALETGLSGTGRLHDLFVTLESMTPGEYRKKGKSLEIRYGFVPTAYGRAIISATDLGVCGIGFPESDSAGLKDQQAKWPLSSFVHDQKTADSYAQSIFGGGGSGSITCRVKGSQFQCKVWEALLTVPAGSVTTYSRLARAVGSPEAARAAGTAVGANPIAYLIPCHRVIRETGALGGYRWGLARKQAMLARETAALEA